MNNLSVEKRGDYWLTPEGRKELRETFDDPNDGNAVRPLLDALERTEKLAANGAEPVAQQPPPSREHALDELTAIGQEMGEYAVQQPPLHDFVAWQKLAANNGQTASVDAQPEAPTLADGLVRYWSRTTAQGERMTASSDGYWTPWHEAVVRIRELEAERDSWAQQADDRVTDAVQFCKERDEARSDLAASRERERAKDAALRAILAVSKRHQTATMNTISDCANIALAPDSAASPTGEAK